MKKYTRPGRMETRAGCLSWVGWLGGRRDGRVILGLRGVEIMLLYGRWCIFCASALAFLTQCCITEGAFNRTIMNITVWVFVVSQQKVNTRNKIRYELYCITLPCVGACLKTIRHCQFLVLSVVRRISSQCH